MRSYGWAAAAALAAIATGSQAAELTPTDIIHRHMDFAAKNDLDALVGDFADDGIFLTAGRATQGKAAIRKQFAPMVAPRAAGAPAPEPIVPQRIWQEGDVGFVTWTRGAMSATDEFIVRHGKILVQAVFVNAPGAPPPSAPPAK